MQTFKVEDRVWIKSKKVKAVVKEVEDKKYKCTYFENGERQIEWFEVNQLTKFKKKDVIYFAKVKPNAKIPSKDHENGCYDIYACFDEDFIEIQPGEIKLVPTGIASCFNSKYRLSLRERGSSGSKGLAKRAGEVDSGYRNEIFVAINNTVNKTIIIAKEEWLKDDLKPINSNWIIYPYEKAIAQAALEFVPNVFIKEISYEELKQIPSKRGMGNLGSSGK